MNYYEIAIIGHNLELLTYESELALEVGAAVYVDVKRGQKEGVVVKQCDKPSFKTSPVKEALDRYYSKEQMGLAGFLSSYYVCELSIALALFEPFVAVPDTAAKIEVKTDIELSVEQ
ncbi:MAG TPA: primosomal protein N', partial [Campylobacterales bacterium]|nr:primosomal protein N' [Campylobacterales bacterium]